MNIYATYEYLCVILRAFSIVFNYNYAENLAISIFVKQSGFRRRKIIAVNILFNHTR